MKSKILGAFALLILLTAAMSSLFVFSASADAPKQPSIKNCRAACLFDKTHGRMIYSENASEPLHTSTSAKVMTGLLFCELLEDRLSKEVKITEDMLALSSGYSMGLKAGDRIKIEDLLYGAVCGSYNDAAYALACIASGSASDFVSLMNERARQAGAHSTTYTNPLGYPDDSAMMTTLSDTLKIALEASDNELYMNVSSAKSRAISINGKETTVYNRNLLVSSRTSQEYYNRSCLGMNAGSSGEKGGWSVITLARDEGVEYICVILGGSEGDDQEIFAYSEANRLIDWVSEEYNMHKVFDNGQVLGHAEISMTSLGRQSVECIASDELSVYIPNRSSPEVTYELKYLPDKCQAPIKAGDCIGSASVFCNGELVGECEITVGEDIEANIFMKAIEKIALYTQSRAFVAAAVFLAIALPITLIIMKRRNGTHRMSRRKY